MYDKSTDDKPVYKKKFAEFRTELRHFLKKFLRVASLKCLKFKHRKTKCTKINFESLGTDESFTDFDKFADYDH